MTDRITKSIIVQGDVSDIYQLWANFENFPHFMENIESVTKTGSGLSHWVMKGPLGQKIEWDAETTRMEENKRIGWNSKDNSDLTTSGQVTFNPLPSNQVEVTITLQYQPPAGKLGEAVAHLFDNPERKLEEDLQRFKAYAERISTTSRMGMGR
ncbi:MAG: SRPBCC family protein [Anaerolineae bacterium]|nr:SRPBCC family protein [Anaerolineae bacterium]